MAIKVLVIDDSPATGRLIESLFEKHPEYTLVGVAQSGAEGIKLFRETQPDIVCLDVLMPGLGGVEVLRTLRSLDPTVKVLIISALGGSPKMVESLVQAGATSILAKPISEEALVEQLNRLASL